MPSYGALLAARGCRAAIGWRRTSRVVQNDLPDTDVSPRMAMEGVGGERAPRSSGGGSGAAWHRRLGVAELFESVAKRATPNAKQSRGAAEVVAALLQCMKECGALDFMNRALDFIKRSCLRRHTGTRERRGLRRRKVSCRDQTFAADNRGSFDGICELTHVAAPRCVEHVLDSILRKAHEAAPRFPRQPVQEMIGQSEDVVAAVTERRNVNRKHVED